MKKLLIRYGFGTFSRLPVWFLYILSNILSFVLYRVIGYRYSVIEKNIRNSFPEKTETERRKIISDFYAHLADIFLEGVKSMTASKSFLKNRMRVRNPEIMEALYKNQRSVLLVSGHYNNWEYLIASQALLFPHKAFGLGTALRDEDWNRYVMKKRERFGMNVIYGRNMHNYFSDKKHAPHATLMLSDQSPGRADKAYWMQFLNRETGVRFGVEKLAHHYNMAVVFIHIQKLKRGFYECDLELLCEDPSEFAYGEITRLHTEKLEKIIRNKPEQWLWSHKRWKKSKPENYVEIERKYRLKFQEMYR